MRACDDSHYLPAFAGLSMLRCHSFRMSSRCCDCLRSGLSTFSNGKRCASNTLNVTCGLPEPLACKRGAAWAAAAATAALPEVVRCGVSPMVSVASTLSMPDASSDCSSWFRFGASSWASSKPRQGKAQWVSQSVSQSVNQSVRVRVRQPKTTRRSMVSRHIE